MKSRAGSVSKKEEGKMLFELEIPVPGYTTDELDIRVQGDLLVIRGDRSRPLTDLQSYHVLEAFAFDSFERSYRLGEHLCREGVKARVEGEMLRVIVYDIPASDEHSDKKVPLQ